MTRTLDFRLTIATIVMGTVLVACSTGGQKSDSPTTVPLQDVPPAVSTTPAPIESSVPAPTPTQTPGSAGPETPPKAPLAAYPEISIASIDSFSGDFVVGGYVTGVVEIGGSCTFVVINKATGAEVRVGSTGIDNSDSTSCGSVDIAGNKIPNGEYSVLLEYANANGSATSEPLSVVVSR